MPFFRGALYFRIDEIKLEKKVNIIYTWQTVLGWGEKTSRGETVASRWERERTLLGPERKDSENIG